MSITGRTNSRDSAQRIFYVVLIRIAFEYRIAPEVHLRHQWLVSFRRDREVNVLTYAGRVASRDDRAEAVAAFGVCEKQCAVPIAEQIVVA